MSCHPHHAAATKHKQCRPTVLASRMSVMFMRCRARRDRSASMLSSVGLAAMGLSTTQLNQLNARTHAHNFQARTQAGRHLRCNVPGHHRASDCTDHVQHPRKLACVHQCQNQNVNESCSHITPVDRKPDRETRGHRGPGHPGRTLNNNDSVCDGWCQGSPG